MSTPTTTGSRRSRTSRRRCARPLAPTRARSARSSASPPSTTRSPAIGEVDLAIVPAGDGPTIGGTAAAELALSLGASWVVPMHYRTPRIAFLETEEEFAAAFPHVVRPESTSFDTSELERPSSGALAVIPAAP